MKTGVVAAFATMAATMGGCHSSSSSGGGTGIDLVAPSVTSTIPVDNGTDVPLNTQLAVTFSESMNPLTITPDTFTLHESINPIAGTITYSGVTATFTPSANLAPNTVYTAMVWSEVEDEAGNTMASDYVWTFTTGTTTDATAPTVSSTVPNDGTSGVPTTRKLSATFSEAMDASTLSAATFTLNDGVNPVTGTVTYAGVTATFTPDAPMAANTLHTAEITTGATDLSGNPMASNYSWTFTTGTTADGTAPTVSSTVPSDGDIDVPLNQKVAATFSEEMDPLTTNTTTFTLSDGANLVTGSVNYAGVTATFAPRSDLAPSTLYTAVVTGDVEDLAGNPMGTDFTWTFTTGAAPDITAPTVSSTDPIDGAIDVPLNQKVAATFSETMEPLTITTTNFTLSDGVNPVAGTVNYTGVTATFTPSSDLAPSTLYTAVVSGDVTDLAGNPMGTDFTWTFTTGVAPDITAPFVTSNDPLNNAIGVPINKDVSAVFSEFMDPLTITTNTFTLNEGINPVTGTVSYVDDTATFMPTANLAFNTLYTAMIWMEVEDLAGNSMIADHTWEFMTGTTTAQEPIDLKSANAFAILAGSTVTNTGASIITGDLGVSPGTAIVGFPPGIVNGTIFTGVGSAAGQAKLDLTEAFNEAAGRSTGPVSLPGDLTGLTLYPGLYKNSTSVMLSVGTVTLDAQGDSNAVFLFQMGSTLTTGSATEVILAGGAEADNVYWQVGTSATLGTNSIFKGNILAQEAITLNTGATLDGRALTQTAAVDLDTAVITIP